MRYLLAAGVAVLFLIPASHAAPDVTGRWVWRIDNGDGSFRDTVFALTQQGSSLTGSVITTGSETPIVDGAVDGDAIRFATSVGPAANPRRTEYRGTLAAGELRLTIVRAGRPDEQVTAARGSDDAGRLPARVEPPALHRVPDNGLARTPPMGWNSWNHFRGKVDDATVRAIADAMVTSGLKRAGYEYVNIDDTWEAGRDASGKILTNRKFPDMKALADYVHSKGLKLGIYSGPGPYTCAGYTASYGHEEDDARTYAAWGIDYLKYDWCSASRLYKDDEMQAVYQKMGDALRATGRPIVFSLCQYGRQNVWTWGPAVGGNLWRTTGDISDTWASMSRIGFDQDRLAEYASPGHWNDPDMLEVGNGGMSEAEYRTHMSLWALLAAPLLAGNDLRSMTPEIVAILTNPDVIAIDQDRVGKQGRRVRKDGDLEVWTKPLEGGAIAAGFFNRGSGDAVVTSTCDELKACGDYRMRNLWTHETGTVGREVKVTVPSHGVALFRISPASGPAKEKPDFGGEWLLTTTVADATTSQMLVVHQWAARYSIRGELLREPLYTIAIDRHRDREVSSEEHPIGVVGGIVGGIPAGGQRVQAVSEWRFSTGWDDDRLVLESTRFSGTKPHVEAESEHKEVWSLDADGSLHVDVTDRSDGAEPTTTNLVYRRRD